MGRIMIAPCLLLLTSLPAPAQTAPPSDERATEAQEAPPDAALFESLRNAHALDRYLVDQVGAIARDLVSHAGRWGGLALNRGRHPSELGLYLVDSARLPTDESVGISAGDIEGNAVAIEGDSIVVDTRLLKTLAIAAFPEERSEGWMERALVRARIRGLSSARTAWDPQLNLALAKDGVGRQLLWRGAVAFVIAHEMGHLVAPRRKEVTIPRVQMDAQDARMAQACPALLDPEYEARQQSERAADAYAAGLLQQFCLDDLMPPSATYQLGAEWYFVYHMQSALLDALAVSDSVMLHGRYRAKLGGELLEEFLRSAHPTKETPMHKLFTSDHPAGYRRAAVLATAGPASCSPLWGTARSSGTDLLEMLLRRACEELAVKYASPHGHGP